MGQVWWMTSRSRTKCKNTKTWLLVFSTRGWRCAMSYRPTSYSRNFHHRGTIIGTSWSMKRDTLRCKSWSITCELKKTIDSRVEVPSFLSITYLKLINLVESHVSTGKERHQNFSNKNKFQEGLLNQTSTASFVENAATKLFDATNDTKNLVENKTDIFAVTKNYLERGNIAYTRATLVLLVFLVKGKLFSNLPPAKL